ncbi:MAG: sodium/solute symporter [Clostridia bacterium]|nr:sodium/solute symporter [Clostridia bacterium]
MKYAVLVLYAVMIVSVLVLTARKSLSLKDFLLGGRNVGAWMSALSYGASYFSAVIIVGYAGSMGWQFGIAAAWAGIGNAVIGSLLAWSLLARPVRRMGEKLDVGTIPGFFEKRYNAKWMKLAASVIIFIFLIPYSASVYKGLGTMFRMALGIDYTWCVIGIAVLAALYLFAGGYRATAITDFIQGIIMIAGVLLIIWYIIRGAGGLKEGLAQLGQLEGSFNSMAITKENAQPLLSNVLLTSLGVLGLPQMLHKFFAIKDTKSVKRATIISTSFALIIAGGIYFAGGFGRVVLSKIPDATYGTAAAAVEQGGMVMDQIMPTMLTDQTVVGIPDWLQGLFIVLLLSASISTLTALVLASASVISVDLLGTIFPKRTEKQKTFTMRILCLVFVGLSLVINFLMQNTPIMQLMSLSWGVVAGSFLAPFMYGLLWKGTTRLGAWAGLLCGFLTALLPPLFLGTSVAALSGVSGMIAGLIVVPVVSLLTRSTLPPESILKTAFSK